MVGMIFEPGSDCGDPVEPPQGAGRGRLAAEITGIEAWVNSEPLCLSDLRGNVVLVDFWTYTCINCIRTFPYLRQWHARYADDGLVILGIHTPEFEFEEDRNNVQKASADDAIVWPVALDNDMGTWRAYKQPLLASEVPHRQGRRHPLPTLRRGRVRRDRAGNQKAVGRSRR